MLLGCQGHLYLLVRDLNVSESESVWIELNFKNQENKLIVGVIYSSPNQRNVKSFTDSLGEKLEKLSLEGKRVIIMGDMNVDLYKIKSTDNYAVSLLSNAFQNAIYFPTRTTDTTCTLIDHVLTNINDLDTPITSGVIINDISDHNMTFVNIPIIYRKDSNNESKTVLSFKKYNKGKIIRELSEVSWADVTSEDDPEIAYNLLYERIKEIQDKYIIKTKVTPKNDLMQPWMTEGIRRAQKQRYKLYKQAKQHPNNDDRKTKYITYKNKLCAIMRRAEKEYYHGIIEESQGNQSKIWHIINNLIGKKRKPSSIPKCLINDDNQSFDNPRDISNEMNRFFTQVGPKLSSEIPQSEIDPLSYVPPSQDYTAFLLKPVCVNETLAKLQKIKTNKAPGPDQIHPRFARDIACYIAAPLTHIVNLGLEKGIIPKGLKIARVIPSYKSGDRRKATNYRPISILPIFAKVYEGLVYDRLENYLESKNILNTSQYGFQKNKNTTTALLEFINKIQSSTENNQHTLAVIPHLRAAWEFVWR